MKTLPSSCTGNPRQTDHPFVADHGHACPEQPSLRSRHRPSRAAELHRCSAARRPSQQRLEARAVACSHRIGDGWHSAQCITCTTHCQHRGRVVNNTCYLAASRRASQEAKTTAKPTMMLLHPDKRTERSRAIDRMMNSKPHNLKKEKKSAMVVHGKSISFFRSRFRPLRSTVTWSCLGQPCRHMLVPYLPYH
jgi:hypothetical protein